MHPGGCSIDRAWRGELLQSRINLAKVAGCGAYGIGGRALLWLGVGDKRQTRDLGIGRCGLPHTLPFVIAAGQAEMR